MRTRWVGAILVAAGCSGGAGRPDATFTVVRTDAGVLEDAGPPDGSIDLDDDNDSFDEAAALALGDAEGVSGVIQAPLDRDYYRIEIAEPGWIEVRTVSNIMYVPTGIDTSIFLHEGADNVVAGASTQMFWNAYPERPDAQLWYYADAPGTYYVEVLEGSDPLFRAGRVPRADGHPDFYYRLIAEPLAGRAGLTFDPETGDDAASAVRAPMVEDRAHLLGRLADGSDVDVYAVDLAPTASTSIIWTWHEGAPGTNGTVVRLTDAAGSAVIATNELFPWIRPSVPSAGTYLVWVARSPDATAGANDFYAVEVRATDETLTLEAEDPEAPGSNDTVATAERVTLAARSGGDRSAVIGARLSADTDEDVFAFTVRSGERIFPNCQSLTDGSGVIGLTLEVIDPAGAVVGTAVETERRTAGLLHVAGASGDFAIRVSKTGQNPDVQGDFVRCTIGI